MQSYQNQAVCKIFSFGWWVVAKLRAIIEEYILVHLIRLKIKARPSISPAGTLVFMEHSYRLPAFLFDHLYVQSYTLGV